VFFIRDSEWDFWQLRSYRLPPVTMRHQAHSRFVEQKMPVPDTTAANLQHRRSCFQQTFNQHIRQKARLPDAGVVQEDEPLLSLLREPLTTLWTKEGAPSSLYFLTTVSGLREASKPSIICSAPLYQFRTRSWRSPHRSWAP